MLERNSPAAERVDAAGLLTFMSGIAAKHSKDELTFLCIGTDRSTGDSLGPWVGTMLEEKGFTRVIGTLREPCDADKAAAFARFNGSGYNYSSGRMSGAP
ncbi:DUF1256 domain-containing protein [Cohnella luojiensis]|uniref:DUF1256 domain-containing protein n=1 Tax=Cohnella luojiensis TaxID=652876 RepID=UPI0023EA5028|nr:DUF1256 domain-containing protein [Cohnella luojiensis]